MLQTRKSGYFPKYLTIVNVSKNLDSVGEKQFSSKIIQKSDKNKKEHITSLFTNFYKNYCITKKLDSRTISTIFKVLHIGRLEITWNPRK